MPYPVEMTPSLMGLSNLAQDVLPVLYQHRLVGTGQLRALLQPHVERAVYLRQQLTRLSDLGLVAATLRRRSGQSEKLWFVTPLGMEVVEAAGEVPPRAYRISQQAATSQLQEHTLATVDTGVAFVEWARRRGDECGPLHWQPEVAHRIRDGESRAGDDAVLVPDAVLSYIQREGDVTRLLTYFVEVDRATMPITRLLAKLHAYARYRTYVPPMAVARRRSLPASAEAWRERYIAFPRLLLVLAGADEKKLAARRADLRALVEADARMQRVRQFMAAGVTTLTQLQDEGPFAPIVTPIFGELTASDILMQPPALQPT